MRRSKDLTELIQFLENEKEQLKVLIRNCVEEEDFKMAKAHAKTSHAISRQLRNLYRFQDPDFDKKYFLNHQKQACKDQIKKENNPELIDFHLDNISDLNAELNSFDDKVHEAFLDTQFIDDAIFDLVENKIKSFRLHLIKDENASINFKLTGTDVLTMSLYVFGAHDNLYHKKSLKRKIKGLGFTLQDDKKVFRYEYSLKNFKDALFLKTLLSRLIFDVLQVHMVDRVMTIEIEP